MRTDVGPHRAGARVGTAHRVSAIGVVALCLVAFSCPLWAQTSMTRVSLGPGGTQGNGHSSATSISADGRFVAFTSSASNLVADDTNGVTDVFVHDRSTGTTARVSVSSEGGQGNGDSLKGTLSGDGRFVAFESDATNLVAGDSNASHDIFLHDRQTGATTRVSVGPGGAEANGASYGPSLSADGRFVAFFSNATNLVPEDTNNVTDVFVHDRQTGLTERVSVGAGGIEANGLSEAAALSANGRFVAFCSYANNLVEGDTSAAADIFVRDRDTGTTTRVSVGPGGVEADGYSYNPAVSADGRIVAFYSYADNLVADDWNAVADVFVHDRQTGTTTRVSAAPDSGESWDPTLSGDGRFVAFVYADVYWEWDDWDGWWYWWGVSNVFVYDRESGATTQVSVSGAAGPSGDSYVGFLSSDGRIAAFGSSAANLVPGDTNDVEDVFVRDGAAFGSKISPLNEQPYRELGTWLSWSSIWMPGGGAAAYEYCYDTTDDNACDGAWTAATGSSVLISGLAPATTYYWQVRAGTAYADNGTWWSFTTAPLPGAFVKSSPTHQATGQLVPVTLTWTSSVGATGYEYCYDTIDNAACDGTWMNATGATAVLSGLAGTTTYFWQVRARTPAGVAEADDGAWWAFTTSPPPPLAFGKSSPTYGALQQPASLALKWTAASGATSYEYCYDKVNNNLCDGTWVSAGPSTSVTVTGLTWGSNYYWQVRALNAYGTTYADGGAWYWFRVGQLPGEFAKSSPANGATLQPATLGLYWSLSGGATGYEYCYDTTDNAACDGSWTAAPGQWVVLTGLSPGTTYYWQVRSWNAASSAYADGVSAWWSFRTAAPPGMFGKLSPANYATQQPIPLTLTWTVSAGATGYDYCYDTSNDTVCDSGWIPAAGTSATVANLSPGTSYYWLVRANAPEGTAYADGAWWGFTTVPATPGAFGVSYPADGATQLPTPMTVTWSASSGAVGYEYCYDSVNNNACDGSWVSAGSGTTATLSGLSPGATYYLQVRANGSSGTTYANGGAWWSFTTAPRRTAPFTELDEDGKADVAVYRSSTGEWWGLLSGTGYIVQSGYFHASWGMPGDVPVPGDYDGDGKTDAVVFRPSTGEWWGLRSSNDYDWQSGFLYANWGMPGDVPVPGDYDGDGKADLVIFRPSTGEWRGLWSSNGYDRQAGWLLAYWGAVGDVPVPGDFDGDGRADVAVYRPSTGEWWALLSGNNYVWQSGYFYACWGLAGDIPVPGDYDGDGKTDPVIYRPSTGEWWGLQSGNGYNRQSGWLYASWGLPDDIPVPDDYDGDGKTDPMVFRPSTDEWWGLWSSNGYSWGAGYLYLAWGQAGDAPVRR